MATVGTNTYANTYGHTQGQQQYRNELPPQPAVQQPPQRQQAASNNKRIPVVVGEVIEDQTTLRIGGIRKRYRTGKCLGRGGFAKCFQLTSFDTGRIYAGKVIPKASLVSQNSKKKLHNEIRLHRSINHKHVVKFERYFDDNDNIIMLLELCSQQTLMELSKARGSLSETEVQYFLWQIIDVVHVLHANNIIHRDLKLGNLFLDSNMNIKLGDFGLATRLDYANERKKTICGTPNYIAPEILYDKGAGHSFEVDIWAIGVIAFTLLYGKPPFETASVKTTYQKIKDISYDIPSEPATSPAAKDFIRSILQSSPTLRPTLEQLRVHSFFTQSPFPTTMPTTIQATPFPFVHSHLRKDRNIVSTPFESQLMIPFPEIVTPKPAEAAADKENIPTVSSSTSSAKPATSLAPRALPLTAVNVNTHNNAPAVTTSGKVGITNTQLSLAKNEVKNVQQPRDEVASLTAALRNVNLNEDKTARPAQRTAVASPVAPTPAAVRSDIAPNSQTQELASDVTAPSLWVNLWVDYSNKYGLGYLLSNGACGVHFNDYSKMVLHANGSDVQYIVKSNDSDTYSLQTFKIDQFPVELTKKTTLLNHFLKYLVQHNQSSAPQPGADDYLMYTEEFCRETAHTHSQVHVKSWLRTEEGIVFRLSNRTTQIIFFDETELVLNTESRVVSYTDKDRNRTTYPLSEVFNTNRPDLHKRMKFAGTIMSQSQRSE